MLKNIFCTFFLIISIIGVGFFPLMSFEYEEEIFECSSRYAFPITCKRHFSDDIITVNSWMEAEDVNTLVSFKRYQNLIPRCYEADCYHCNECGGVKFNLYQGFDDPTDIDTIEVLRRQHTKIKYGREYNCESNIDHCEDLCWNGGYFRRWNHKYIHFFKHFLEYCAENKRCRCYWPEIDALSGNINETIYQLLKKLAKSNHLTSEFSKYWKATYYDYDCKGDKVKVFDYFPNFHGIASSLTTYTFFYSQYHQMLFSVIGFIDSHDLIGENAKVIDEIFKNLEKLSEDFTYQYDYCLRWHPHPKLYYERGMLKLHCGNYENALTDISNFMRLAEKSQINITSDMYQQEGQVYNELGMYDHAIKDLTEAINLDPGNRGAYFNRAQAYFETSQFELAIQDYLASHVHEANYSTRLKPSLEIKEAILNGLMEGGKEAAINFFPSLCESAYGLGTSLWAFIDHPIDSTNNVINACYEINQNISEFINSVDLSKTDYYIQEFQWIRGKLDRLSEFEKAHLIGYLIGKYGVDIFAGGTTLKSFSLFKKLKDTNRIANLEALAKSGKSRETIRAAAIKHAADCKDFFKNVKINWDKQNKHIPGKHNYMDGKSIFLHPDAQGLVDKFAGTGKPLKNRKLGHPDFREKINFGEFIGYHIQKNTGIKTPTCWGEIRYSKNDVHIVPAFPE